jgi:endonuclease YncB( thermonuclease family)
MIEAVQILWSPAGATMPALGARALVDVTDGDTPNIRMPVRMLSVDTPEVTARTQTRAATIDAEFAQLAEWIGQQRAPISQPLADFLVPKLAGGGTRQFNQGKDASAFATQNIDARLTRPNGTKRNLFIRTADSPFDNNDRLLAYLAPDYTPTERRTLTRAQRATFNLDLVEHGWAAPFVIYPSIPGELDLPLLLAAASQARTGSPPRGIWADAQTLLAYEYRAMEKLFHITKRIVGGATVSGADAHGWRERYCVDMRTRLLHGPEDWFRVLPEYRLWIWPQDVSDAVSRLNLVPSPRMVAAE